MLRKFMSYYKKHMGLFVTDMICAFLMAVVDLLFPMFTRKITNDFIPNNNFRMVIIFCLICSFRPA